VVDAVRVLTEPAPGDATAADDTSDLLARSEAARTRGDYRGGRLLAEQAVALAAAAGDDTALALGLRLVCNQALRLGDVEDAARAGNEAVLVAERLGDRAGQVDALNLLSFAYLNLALYDEALDSIERSIERALTLDDPELRSGTFNRAGTIRSAMGDFAEAAELFDRASEEIAGGGVSSETVFCLLTNTADLVVQEAHSGREVDTDRLHRGVDLSQRALVLAHEVGNPYRQALSLLNSGTLSAYLGDAEVAETTLATAMALTREHGYRGLEVGVLETLAMDAQRRRAFAEAVERFDDVVALATEVHDASVLARAFHNTAQCHEELGQFREALAAYRRFHDLESTQRTQTAEVRARLLGQTVELSELRHEAASLGRQAHEDPLTGLDNRRSFDVALPELLAGACERDLVCVALLDVDHFKRVNDTFGHAVGDEVLRRLGVIMREEVRRRDVLARIGGEEFALVCLLPGPERVDHLADGMQLRLDRLRRKVSETCWDEVVPGLHVTVSIGAVLTGLSGAQSADDLLRAADELLYAAKAAGRDRVLTRHLTVR
jgi:diguanylate cyclase (GGDEF)-like protein